MLSGIRHSPQLGWEVLVGRMHDYLGFSCIPVPEAVPGTKKGLPGSLSSKGPAEATLSCLGLHAHVLSCFQVLEQAGTSVECSTCCPQVADPHLGSSGSEGYWGRKCPLADSSPAPRARSLLQTRIALYGAAIHQALP